MYWPMLRKADEQGYALEGTSMAELLSASCPCYEHTLFASGGTHLGGVPTALMSAWRRLAGGKIDIIAGDSLYRLGSSLVVADNTKETREAAMKSVRCLGEFELKEALRHVLVPEDEEASEAEAPADDPGEGGDDMGVSTGEVSKKDRVFERIKKRVLKSWGRPEPKTYQPMVAKPKPKARPGRAPSSDCDYRQGVSQEE